MQYLKTVPQGEKQGLDVKVVIQIQHLTFLYGASKSLMLRIDLDTSSIPTRMGRANGLMREDGI